MAERTHYAGCWREHMECAVAEIERLREDIERSTANNAEMATEIEQERSRADRLEESLDRWRKRAGELGCEVTALSLGNVPTKGALQMLTDADWLRRKIDNDPDPEICEAGSRTLPEQDSGTRLCVSCGWRTSLPAGSCVHCDEPFLEKDNDY